MSDSQVPIGTLFSRVYLANGTLTPDSLRVRVRLYGHFENIDLDVRKVAELIQNELGVKVRFWATYSGSGYSWEEYFNTCDIRDLLDTVTIIWQVLQRSNKRQEADKWRVSVAKIFREERVQYSVDDQCGVRFNVDQQFHADTIATIASMDNARFAKPRDIFKTALSRFDEHPPACKDAIRDTFEAAETLVKIILGEGRITRLEATIVDRHLIPLVRQKFSNNKPAVNAATSALNSLSDWINAAHHYRHGQDCNSPIEPPVDLAIYLVSLGASHIRYLAKIFNETTPST